MASNGIKDIYSSDDELELKIDNSQGSSSNTMYLESDIYTIKSEKLIISKVSPNTTISNFLKNINTNASVEILDRDGNVVSEDRIIGTGMTLRLNGTVKYKLSVKADTDGDGLITLVDLAQIKLHLIEKEFLSNDEELDAADLNVNETIDLTDLAKVRLVIVDLLKIEEI